MNEFQKHWNEVFKLDDKQSIDIISSVTEDGVNHLLRRSHEIDASLPVAERKYTQTFERTFDTFDDPRKFKLTLSIVNPLKFKLPPFTSGHLSPAFESNSGWNQYLHSPLSGPELSASSLSDNSNLVEMSAPAVTIKLEWDKLDGSGSHSWEIPPFEVLGLVALELHKDENYFIKIIPKKIKFIIDRGAIENLAAEAASKAEQKDRQENTDCEEKFVDLFIIAANIAAYEQTPKLIMSIDLPALTLVDRPVIPAAFDISHNMMSLGFGLDREALSQYNARVYTKKENQLNAALENDIEREGGLENIALCGDGKPRTHEEQIALFTQTNQFIEKQAALIKAMEDEDKEIFTPIAGEQTAQDSFAIGINEYFLDTLARSTVPEPKYECSDEKRVLDLVKGNVCNWTTIKNPDFNIQKVGSTDVKLEASTFIDMGGKIRACVKKFWDCSWKWSCSSLALALVGRPKLKIKVLRANGVRILANVDTGSLRVKTNLKWPFNKVVEFFATWVVRGIVGIVNILAALLSFHVIKPNFDVQSLNMRLKLRNFGSFYFEKTQSPSADKTKNKFMCFSTKISASKLPQ